MAYPLAPLMAVRLFREDAARRAVRAAEHAVAAAKAVVAQTQEELERYRRWRPEEENRRYAAILHQALSAAELDTFKAGLVALSVAEQQREQAVLAAEETLAQRRRDLDRCKGQMAQARRDSARLETHRDIWNGMQRREEARKEDLELEDFRPAPSMEADE